MLALIACLSIAATCHSASETTEYRGYVKDVYGDPIPGALVIISDASGAAKTHATTDNDGAFRLACPAKMADGTISFACLGFKKETISLAKFDNGADVTLTEENMQLKEVTVRIAPISVKNDTLTYNVDSFKNASDRSIEDVLKRLPGISVSDEGRIYYNGEAINKFYIEGLDLLSGRYSLASRNISPDDVAAVNVYENHQSKRVLKDIEYSDKAAINLRLKKKSLLRPIGYAKAGAGCGDNDDFLWLGEAFGLFISPDAQALVSAKANNSGSTYINETRSLTGNESNMTNEVSGLYPLYPFGKADIPTDRFMRNRSISASTNSLVKVSEHSSLSFMADYSDEITDFQNQETITYATSDSESTSIRENADNSPHVREAKVKINLETNSQKKYISDALSFTGHFDSNQYHVENANTYRQRNLIRDFNFRNDLNAIFKTSHCVLEFTSNTWIGSAPDNTLTASSEESVFITQNIKSHGIRNKEEIGYSWLINKRSSIGLKSALDIDCQEFDSYDQDQPTLPTNDVTGHKISVSIEPAYQLKPSSRIMVNVSLPIRLSRLKYKNLIEKKEAKANRCDVDFKTRINYNSPFNLKTALTIGRQNNIGGISDYLTNPIHITFRQTSILGSGKTNRRTSHYANLTLAYRNAIEGIFSSASLMYRHTASNRIGGISINTNDNITASVQNLDNTTNQINTSISLSKTFFDINTSVNIDGGYETLNKQVMRQNSVLNVGMRNYLCRMAINSSPVKNYVNISLLFNYMRSSQKIDRAGQRSSTRDASISLKCASNPFANFEIFASALYHRSDLNKDKARKSVFIDCGARYRIGRIDAEISARNLTNEHQYSYSYVLDSDVYAYSFRLRPLEVLLSLRYSF